MMPATQACLRYGNFGTSTMQSLLVKTKKVVGHWWNKHVFHTSLMCKFGHLPNVPLAWDIVVLTPPPAMDPAKSDKLDTVCRRLYGLGAPKVG
jgi:hypothetical protein